MDNPQQAAVEQFLTDHQPALAKLTLEAYAAAGGHYLALSEADRRRQAAIDAAEFSAALRDRVVDMDGIARVVAAGATQAVLEDIVRMVAAQERLLVEHV